MIKYKVGEMVSVNQTYVEEILKSLSVNARQVATLGGLGYCGTDDCKVADLGFLTPPLERICYIRVVPADIHSSGYRNGEGIALFFDDVNHLNECFASKIKVTKPKATKPKTTPKSSSPS